MTRPKCPYQLAPCPLNRKVHKLVHDLTRAWYRLSDIKKYNQIDHATADDMIAKLDLAFSHLKDIRRLDSESELQLKKQANIIISLVQIDLQYHLDIYYMRSLY